MNLGRQRLLGSLALLTVALTPPLSAQSQSSPTAPAMPDTAPPPIEREFRGVWVATVDNIDWPSRPGLSTWEQQAELIAILNRAVALRMNAVIFQVRPQADAVYSSDIEPWSPYITGQMGRAPEPRYDPLEFAVREAHARGLELHAWFNPFRALRPSSPGDAAPSHVSKENPALVRKYANLLWLDPGDSAVVARSLRAILDVVRRYDIDGVHIDDYFYPYPERDRNGKLLDFPDSASWNRYRQNGGTLTRDDWRRHNVDAFVERLGDAIHAEKPWVKFGVSPFGIWRPGYPPQITGLDAYSVLYADARKWLQSGWVDYLAPQLYWPIARTAQSYPVLLDWWIAQNTQGRHIWPGIYAGFARDSAPHGRGSAEILDQIRLTRARAGSSGNVFFSMKVFQDDPDSLDERLVRDVYIQPALVPPSPWLSAALPHRPSAYAHRDPGSGNLLLHLSPGAQQPMPWLWVIQTRGDSGWTTQILPGTEHAHFLAPPGGVVPLDVRIYAVGRTGNVSASARVTPE